MTERNKAVARDEVTGSAKPSPQAPDKRRIASDERRVQDALEDDEVREALRAQHAREP